MPRKYNKLGEPYRRNGRYKGGKYAYALRDDRERIVAQIPADIWDQIMALSWLLHGKEEITPIVHMLLTRGVTQMIADLTPKERALLENRILPNVKINRDIIRKKRREAAAQKNKEMRMLHHDDSTQIFEDGLPELTEDDEIPAP